LRGRGAVIEAVQINGIGAPADSSGQPVELPASMRSALSANARRTAEAAKAALSETLRMISSQVSSTATPQAPVHINGYRVLSKIGEGGMSNVYLAQRESDGEQLVLKILNVRPTDDKEMMQRFVQESAMISEINHNNVVRIYDRGFTEEYAYIAMEYFPGGSLKEVIDRGLTPRQALSLLAQASSALSEIHRLGIVHRDVKPANMMLRADGTMALADFGIAKRSVGAMAQTVHGQFYGTPYYISPEQARGEPATQRSDIYSMGVIFYEMLMGRRPYEGETIVEVLAKHINAPVPKLPPELADYQPLLDGMLEKDPAKRMQDAESVLRAIDSAWTQVALRAGTPAGNG
jgi:serine/threonine protein kinase